MEGIYNVLNQIKDGLTTLATPIFIVGIILLGLALGLGLTEGAETKRKIINIILGAGLVVSATSIIGMLGL
ncbi:MAG: TrbC/VirB2 family protein [Eubacteriales bacterium]|nr:TrbC/VirB2 family protein [Eubacteriales bacterium]